jgi:hypothetical protein
MTLELPEGVTYNNANFNEIKLDFVEEVVNDTKCNVCGLHLQGLLVTINNKHEGVVKMIPSGNVLWKNVLPKDKVRCIKMINDSLIAKLDKHKERHKND